MAAGRRRGGAARCQDVAGRRLPRERRRASRRRRGAARDWLARARRAGMRYAVLTTKHHDGFALWPTRAARLLDRALAVRRRPGARVRRRRARRRPARRLLLLALATGITPTTRRSPTPTAPTASASEPRPTRRAVGALPARSCSPRSESCSPTTAASTCSGSTAAGSAAPRAGAAPELEALIRALQPEILINDRLPGSGDFDTPEQFVPPQPPDARLGDLPDDERELGLEPDATRTTSRRARSCTRSARSPAAAATCC